MCKTKTELDKVVAKYRKAKALQDKLDNQLEALKKDITEYILAKGTVSATNESAMIVNGDGYTLRYLTVKSDKLDTDKVKTLLGADLPNYQKVQISHRLTVK